MRNFLRRIRWKEVICFVLLAAIGIGAVVGISSALTNKTKTISSLAFERGAINEETGVYMESKTSIYTKDVFECQGLVIEPDFEATGTYQVFYYGEYKTFLGATEPMKATAGVYERGDEFPIAKYARIVITPETPVDDDGKVEEDFKIHWYNKLTYANDYTITVDKKQVYVAPDLFATSLVLHNLVPGVDNNTNLFVETSLQGYSYVTVDCKNIDSFKVIFEESADSYTYYFFDKGSACLGVGSCKTGTEFNIDVPERAALLCLIFKTDNIPAIYPFA